MTELVNTKKSKKAQRRMRKRENIVIKKKSKIDPQNICYRVDEENEMVIFTGELKSLPRELCYFIRFKLSGQKEFLRYGYQAKIPIQDHQFHCEIPLVALLDQDEIAFQVFNEQGQTSTIVICEYNK